MRKVEKCRIRRTWWWELGFRVWRDLDCVLVGRVTRWCRPVGPFVRIPDALQPGEDAWTVMEGVVTAMLQRPGGAGAGERPAATLVDVKFKGAYPILWDYMTQQLWEDGTPRETAGLTVFAQDGVFKGLLKDNDAGCCLWAAGSGFFALLGALEAALGTAAPDWRVDRKRPGAAPKKR